MTSAAPTGRLPEWLVPFAELPGRVRGSDLSRFVPPEDRTPRRSAVLLLFGEGAPGPDLLLTERSATLRWHPGQVCFPGGAIDPGDDGPVAAAVREAVEETGLDPRGVRILGTLPEVYVPASGYAVTPVLGWWREPSPVGIVDPAEVARVVRIPLAELVDPGNRFRVSHPSGFVGPGFAVRDLFVWGFTAGLLSRVLALTGWERPWDRDRVEPVPVPGGGSGQDVQVSTDSATGPDRPVSRPPEAPSW